MTTLGMPAKRAGGRIKVCDIYVRRDELFWIDIINIILNFEHSAKALNIDK